MHKNNQRFLACVESIHADVVGASLCNQRGRDTPTICRLPQGGMQIDPPFVENRSGLHLNNKQMA